MKKKAWAGCFIIIASFFITLPIHFYLQFRILQEVNATPVMWLLFWAYVPVYTLIQILAQIMMKVLNDD